MCSSCPVVILTPKPCLPLSFICLSDFIIQPSFARRVVVFVSPSLFRLCCRSSLTVCATLCNIVLPMCNCACITTTKDSSCDLFFAQVCALQHMIQAWSASYLCLLCLSRYLFRCVFTIMYCILIYWFHVFLAVFPCFPESRDVSIFPGCV